LLDWETRTGHQVGTPAFMAPEQVRGLATTPALDIFALGVLACYAATGELPFGGGLDPAVPHRILEQEPDLARCPRRLVDLVTRCLAKDPQRRPSPTQVIELCRTVSTGTRLQMGEGWLPPRMAAVVNQIATAPVPPVPREPRPRRRRRTAVLLAAGFVVVAAAAGIGVAGAFGAFDTKASGVSGTGGSSTAPATTTTVATTTTTSGTTPPTAPATSSTATSAANPGGEQNFVKRFDSVDLAANHGIVFNNDAVEDTNTTDSDLYQWDNTGLSTRGEMIILQTGEPATFDICKNSTRFVTQSPVRDLQVNTKFCVVTDKLISLWEIRRVPQTSEVSRHYEFAITLWRRPTA
jgi:serine/threonine protein kinase